MSGEAATWIPLSDLKPWVKNPRKNDHAVEGVAASLRRFGWGRPLVVGYGDWGEVLLAGHTTLKAALYLERAVPGMVINGAPGPRVAPVRRQAFATEAEAHAYALVDNKAAEASQWDEAMLGDVVRELHEAGADVADLGWDVDEIREWLEPAPSGAGPGLDAPEPPEVPVSRLGEVYELGPHRLVCGDSTKPETWTALLRGEKLQMVWTDPPYGVSIVGGTKDPRRPTFESGRTIENDDLTPEQLLTFLRASLGATFAQCEPGAAWYVAAPAGPLHNVFGTVLIELEVWRRSLMWVKSAFVFGRGDYHYRHEPIFYGWKPGAAHYFIDDRTQDSVHEYARPAPSGKEHPTMKPVDLVRRHIRNSSKPGWIVGEPFGGSGTTLLAAAAEGRIARLIELDPRYCDVIRRRWTAYADANRLDAGPGALRAP